MPRRDQLPLVRSVDEHVEFLSDPDQTCTRRIASHFDQGMSVTRVAKQQSDDHHASKDAERAILRTACCTPPDER